MLVVLQADGAAVDGHSFVAASGNIERRPGAVILIDLGVVGDVEIEKTVAVVIHKSAAGAEVDAFVDQAGFHGNVGKGAVAVVAVQLVLPIVGNEEVFVTVAVVIANANANAP